MKKLILILVLLMPVVLFGQRKLTYKTSEVQSILDEVAKDTISLSNVGVLKADSSDGTLGKKQYATSDDLINGLKTVRYLKVSASNPDSGNIYINSGDKKIHYLSGGYWHRLGILDSTATNLVNGLVSYWKLDDQSTTAVDATGNNNLTVDGATPNQAGKIGTSYSFVTNDFIGGVDNADYELASLSVSAWVKTSEAVNYICIISDSQWDKGYDLSFAPDGQIQWAVGNTANGQAVQSSATGLVNTGAWVHVVATFNGTVTALYFNGSTNDIGSPATWAHAIEYPASDCKFYIGSRNGGLFFNGAIDDVGIWNRALTPTEITSLYNKGNTGLSYPWEQ